MAQPVIHMMATGNKRANVYAITLIAYSFSLLFLIFSDTEAMDVREYQLCCQAAHQENLNLLNLLLLTYSNQLTQAGPVYA